jgi:predicted lipid-binding transport protein (Tim44 family)
MSKNDLDKPLTKRMLGEFVEENLLPAMKEIFVTKEELQGMFEDQEARLCTRLVTKDYVDKKLFELEGKIMDRVIKERKDLKDWVALISGIIRRGDRPTEKEFATLNILEQNIAGSY